MTSTTDPTAQRTRELADLITKNGARMAALNPKVTEPGAAGDEAIRTLLKLGKESAAAVEELDALRPRDTLPLPEEKIEAPTPIGENRTALAQAVKFMKERFGKELLGEGAVAVGSLTLLLGSLEEDAKKQGFKLPWQPHKMAISSSTAPDSQTYSMFPITDRVAWHYYCVQEAQMWSAKEIKYPLDKKQFPTLPKRYQEMYYDLLGFFMPGDGLVSTNVLRFITECTTYAQMMFLIAQLFIEAVHGEGYGMSATGIIPDKKEQERVFKMVDNLPCVKAKANFIKKYINSAKSRAHRYIAQACSEGIFFVTLFAIIFYMRGKGILQAFCFLNEQVAKDESLHRDYYCDQARRDVEGKTPDAPTYEEILEIVHEAVKIEIEHMKYILRKPIDSVEIDTAAGMTVDNLANYAKLLGDQILVFLGVPTHYKVDVKLPWMTDISLRKKTNFYEGTVGSYKKMSVEEAEDWERLCGLKESDDKTSAVSNPSDVDF